MQNTVVRFKNWDLVAWIGEQPGDAMVAVRPIIEAIGLDPAGQVKKLVTNGSFVHRHMSTHDSSGRVQEMLCIPVRQVARWLCGINPRKVRADLTERLMQFQDDCAWTLHDAISGKVTPEVVARLEGMIATLSTAVQMLQEGNVELRKELEQERRARKELQSQIEWIQYRDDMEASNSGRHLRSRRKDIRPPLRLVNT
jgi:hypothetical protein